MFMAAFWLIEAPDWKQPECPSTREWIIVIYLHNGKLVSNKKEQIMYSYKNEPQKHCA